MRKKTWDGAIDQAFMIIAMRTQRKDAKRGAPIAPHPLLGSRNG
jgi:hypothetical protein